MNALTPRLFGRLTALAVVLPMALLAAYCWPSPANGQNEAAAVPEAAQPDSSMQCPMMMGLKGIQLAPDSPPLLLADAQQWNLSAQQQQQLQQIANEARQKARQVLNEDQLEKLQDKPNQAKPLPQIAMQRMQNTQDTKKTSRDSKPMCPMCQKLMKKMQSSNKASNK